MASLELYLPLIKSLKLINMAKKGAVKWNIWSQLGFSYFQQKCFNGTSSSVLDPGTFGVLREIISEHRGGESLWHTQLYPHRCQSQGEPKAGWEGGKEVLAQGFGWCQGSEMSCACSAPVSDGVGPSLGSKTLEVEGPIQDLLNYPVWPFFSSVWRLVLQEDGFQEQGSVPVLTRGHLSALTVTQDISNLPLQHRGQETFPSSVLSPCLLWHWDGRGPPQYSNSIENFIHGIFPQLWPQWSHSTAQRPGTSEDVVGNWCLIILVPSYHS